ncbi:hypothetical protein F4777DRAFT_595401 [Nemania sp. FL0916]|nr:hypothetical protein F4777DRAFT_595401 [Nemania sp. FL0916]
MSGIYDNPQQGAAFTLALLFTPICILCTILRFLATKRAGRRYSWDDWFALLALLSFLPYVVYLFLILTAVHGRPVAVFSKTETDRWYEFRKIGLVMSGIYGIQQTFAKFSLLALYYRLFWVNRSFVRAVWVVAIIQTGWAIVVVFVHIFSCIPVEKSWKPMLPGLCINTKAFFALAELINSAIDFVVAGLAIWMLKSLQMRRLRQWRFGILFAIGAFSGIVGIIRTVNVLTITHIPFLDSIWNLVQMATSIVCCCAPIYQSLVPEVGFIRSLRSWASQTFGADRPSDGSSNGPYDNLQRGGSVSYRRQPQSIEMHAHWQRDGGSEEVLAWTDVQTNQGPGQQKHKRGDEIPMGTIEVEQSYQVV